MNDGRQTIDRDFYDRLVIAFRSTPGNGTAAARHAKCDRRTAARGWEKGWSRYPWAVPIRELLEQEAISARAKAREAQLDQVRQADQERDLARQEAMEAKREESKMLKIARADVLAALSIAAHLAEPMKNIANSIREQCKPQADGSPPSIPIGAATQFLVRYSQIVQRSAGAAELIIQLSRLDRGAATANIGPATDDMSIEEMFDELEAGAEVLAAAKTGKVAGLQRGPTVVRLREADEDELD